MHFQVFDFTDEDTLFPVYCPTCKAHIPRAMSAIQTVCNSCAASAPTVVIPAVVPPPVAPPPSMGLCASCGSRDIYEFKPERGGRSFMQLMLLCMAGLFFLGGACFLFIFWPLLPILWLVAIGFLFAPIFVPNSSGRSRRCHHCGHQWRV